MIDILLYSHHLPAWYCIDIVRRNSVLVTYGGERVKNLNFVSIPNNTNTHKDSANLRLFWPHTLDNNAFTGLVIPLMIND